MIKQLPISLRGAAKSDVRTQFAALCYRIKRGKVQVLLVTSRRTKRWIVPKGWPMEGRTPADSAAQEAWEEGADPTLLMSVPSVIRKLSEYMFTSSSRIATRPGQKILPLKGPSSKVPSSQLKPTRRSSMWA